MISSTTCVCAYRPQHLGGDATEVEGDDAIGHLEHIVHVVRDQHDADPLIGEPAYEIQHLARLRGTERSGGLVEHHHLLSHSTALAMYTVWRWPPERLATFWRTLVTVRTCNVSSVFASEDLHTDVVQAEAIRPLEPEEHVLDDVEVVAQREVLVHDLDLERGRILAHGW